VSGFTLTRRIEAPADQVWEVVGDVGASPHPRIKVGVEREGSSDGTGTRRVMRIAGVSLREEITGVGPGYAYQYRLLDGVPVRDYTGCVVLEQPSPGSTDVRWDVRFRPRVPGSGWLISWTTKYLIDRLLVAAANRVKSSQGLEREGGLSP
jgi:Polyketide cyclase / dehydrase and lipid transport